MAGDRELSGRGNMLALNKSTRTMAVLTVEGPNFPPEYCLYRENALSLLSKQRPWIDATTLGGLGEFVSYRVRDEPKI